ncbi:hypothetical protein BRADI_1g05346v3 [Brachypodium distachyon]|uniref:WRKY domain-containing protein n=1 Tax=Brachypodium distachyon TaxID=15368 RepID=A0A0Q3GNS0_BRADI|nr:hypothetical protein BRADI_1g05346v3 [Brachypodium distachyon]
MEGVEEANRAAVGSCKKLVASLARSGGDPFRPTAGGAETDEAVAMFGKVVTILSNRVGHARARVGAGRKRSSPPLDPSCLLEYHPPPPNNGFRVHGHGSCTPAPPPPPPPVTSKDVLPAAEVDYRAMFLETPLLDLNGCTATAPATATASSSIVAMAAPVQQINTSKSPAVTTNPPPLPPCATKIQFHQHLNQQQQQQQQGKRVQFEQQQKAAPGGGGGEKQQFHMEMAPRSKEPEVISFSFDNNSACTSSASFFTSISSQLISMSDAAAAPAPRTKAAGCGKKGEVDADGRCHCPKKKKPREKRVVRMPAISDKVADIPADNYSWRKYGQKPIKGSPHPSETKATTKKS